MRELAASFGLSSDCNLPKAAAIPRAAIEALAAIGARPLALPKAAPDRATSIVTAEMAPRPAPVATPRTARASRAFSATGPLAAEAALACNASVKAPDARARPAAAPEVRILARPDGAAAPCPAAELLTIADAAPADFARAAPIPPPDANSACSEGPPGVVNQSNVCNKVRGYQNAHGSAAHCSSAGIGNADGANIVAATFSV